MCEAKTLYGMCRCAFNVDFFFFPFHKLKCVQSDVGNGGVKELSAFLPLQSFFESHPAPAAERTVQQCCENILLNAAWLKRDAEDIHHYLLQRKAPPV